MADSIVHQGDRAALQKIGNVKQKRQKPFYRVLMEDDSFLDIGWLYFVINVDGNAFKIGRTKHLHGRISDLQTGNHHQLTLHSAILMPHSSSVEASIHKGLKGSDPHIKGEWYHLCNMPFPQGFHDATQDLAEEIREAIDSFQGEKDETWQVNVECIESFLRDLDIAAQKFFARESLSRGSNSIGAFIKYKQKFG